MDVRLMEYFNKQPRLGWMSTSGKDGKVNVACFGSPRMVDEETVVMALRKNRTIFVGASIFQSKWSAKVGPTQLTTR